MEEIFPDRILVATLQLEGVVPDGRGGDCYGYCHGYSSSYGLCPGGWITSNQWIILCSDGSLSVFTLWNFGSIDCRSGGYRLIDVECTRIPFKFLTLFYLYCLSSVLVNILFFLSLFRIRRSIFYNFCVRLQFEFVCSLCKFANHNTKPSPQITKSHKFCH